MKLSRKIKYFIFRRPLQKGLCVILLAASFCFIKNHIQMISEVSKLNEHTKTRFKVYDNNLPSKLVKPTSLFNWTKKRHNSQKQRVIDDLCSDVPNFGLHTHANLSTYDLLQVTDFTLQLDRNYHFPVKDKFIAHRLNTTHLNNTHLNIFIVPFSHVDPGYGMSFGKYYSLFVKGILDSMVKKLIEYPDMRFQWAETVFLERWWRDIDVQTKMKVRKLVREGQLEIVTGGWVMADEAITTVEGIVDQLLEGHKWIQDKLGAIPVTGWANDPFGYSGVMSHLLKLSGIRNMVILRVHQALKATLAKRGAMEFKWRQYLQRGSESDILCHVMPYTGYWIRDVCGPNKTVCQAYAFMHTIGENLPVSVNGDNVAERAKLLYEQYRITADLYKYDALYIGLGEDFAYSKPEDWDLIYSNFKILMDYMNKQKDWNVSIKFATLSEYFEQVKQNENKTAAEKFQTLSGDFLPYSDWGNDYWTGYYSTRPFQKYLARETERIIGISDVFLVFLKSRFANDKTSNNVLTTYLVELAMKLQGSRRIINSFQHHDGITGTSVQEVASQYGFTLYEAYSRAMSVLKQSVILIMSADKLSVDLNELEHETFRKSRDSLPEHIPLIKTEPGTKLLIVNTLPRHREDVICFRSLSNKLRLTDQTGFEIELQVNNYVKTPGNDEENGFAVAFRINLAPYSIETVKIETGPEIAVEQYVNRSNVKYETDDKIVIKNSVFSAEFNATSGMLSRLIDRKGRITTIDTKFLYYESIKGGAYVFKPISEAKIFPLDLQKANVKFLKGEFISEVRTLYTEGILISYKIYNTLSVQGYGLHIRTELNVRPYSAFWANKEIIIRFKTNVNNQGHFYTDQNGLSLIGRRSSESIPIGGNYYPITKMVVLEDNVKRLTMHTRQPHGVSSLKNGWLDIMLDRTMVTDDHKGLGQGIMDNKLTRSEFVLNIEYKANAFERQEERYTFETKLASLINEYLQHPILVFYDKNEGPRISNKYLSSFRPIPTSLPCDISIIGFRDLLTEEMEYNGTSLTLYRKSFHCGFKSVFDDYCHVNEGVNLESLFSKETVRMVVETSLTHLHKKRSVNMTENMCLRQNEIKSFWILIK